MEEKKLSPLQDPFAQVCSELTALHSRKNHDYGNAFGDVYQGYVQGGQKKMADGYAVGQLCTKVNRIKTLVMTDENWVKNESIEDSLLDLASYAIMTLVERRLSK